MVCTHGESPHSECIHGTRNRARWSPAASSARDPKASTMTSSTQLMSNYIVDLSEIFMLNASIIINQASVREKNWVLHFLSTWLCFGFGHWRHLVLERFIALTRKLSPHGSRSFNPTNNLVTGTMVSCSIRSSWSPLWQLATAHDLFSVFQLNLYL